MTLSRREFVAVAAVAAAGSVLVADWVSAAPHDTRYARAFGAIDAMVARYMREMNAPGLTLAIADRERVLRVATYGMSDADRKEPVRADHLFHIGSITKSFVAITLLQLRDEGKLDLQAPVVRYLPWLRIEPRDVITTHHLLSHSSGLPSWVQVFPTDPAAHRAGFTPGAHFQPDFDLYPFHFERMKEGGKPLTVGHGARWWMSDHYEGPRTFEVPDAWRAFEGHYRNGDPWVGSARLTIRQGKLWVGGTAPLRQTGENTFRFAEPEHNPEWVQFLDVVNGKARRVKFSGYDLWRVDVR